VFISLNVFLGISQLGLDDAPAKSVFERQEQSLIYKKTNDFSLLQVSYFIKKYSF